MSLYDDLMDTERQRRLREKAGQAGKSAAISSGALAGLSSLATSRSIPKALVKGLAYGAGGGALVGGGTLLGEELLGEPDEEEHGAFTRRAGVGAGVGGALLGGALGGLLGAGKLKGLARLRAVGEAAPALGRAASAVKAELPLDNHAVDYLKKWAMSPGQSSAGKSAALGALGLGGLGATLGGSEGMQVDFLEGQDQDERARRRRAMMEAAGLG